MTKPGEDGEPLDGSDCVIRLALHPSDMGNEGLLPNAFNLSTAERESEDPRLSVWETSLTTVEQARSFATNPKRRVVATFDVSVVRNANENLDVVWDLIENPRPGEEGHCGITGLFLDDSRQRKVLRRALVDAVNEQGEIDLLPDSD